jgi:hypothetical protein
MALAVAQQQYAEYVYKYVRLYVVEITAKKYVTKQARFYLQGKQRWR